MRAINSSSEISLACLLMLLAIVAITGLALEVHANTPPPWTVSLDAYSTSNTDTTIEPSHNSTRSFSLGAVINASNTSPIDNVFGWQYAVLYDNTSVSPENYTATGTMVQFGAQTGLGTPNWAGRIAAQQAFGTSEIRPFDPTHQKIFVLLTLLGQATASIAPVLSPSVQGNLLATLNFTYLHTISQTRLSITDLKFVDSNAQKILDINPGPPATENPSSNPRTPPGPGTPTAPNPTLSLLAGPVPYIALATVTLSIATISFILLRGRKPTRKKVRIRSTGKMSGYTSK